MIQPSELAVLKLALIKKGIITREELKEARIELTRMLNPRIDPSVPKQLIAGKSNDRYCPKCYKEVFPEEKLVVPCEHCGTLLDWERRDDV